MSDAIIYHGFAADVRMQSHAEGRVLKPGDCLLASRKRAKQKESPFRFYRNGLSQPVVDV